MSESADLYLNLMKKVLTNVIYEDPTHSAHPDGGSSFDADTRAGGRDWPRTAHTMIGLKRLDNLHDCLRSTLVDDVPGDFVETGVWRGGACIFARAAYAAYGDRHRSVWVVDSFAGMPTVAADEHPIDRAMVMHEFNDVLAISRTEVAENFRRYDLLDDRVQFIEGWFRDTLPAAPIERISVLRLDGDLHTSTSAALDHLYPKLSAGGYVIVDDYSLTPCKQAVHEYRDEHGITAEILPIDGIGAYWRQSG